MEPRIVGAVLIEHNGKFLLGRRNKENYRDRWVIPGGGVKWGEETRYAALRELKEETGIDAEIVRFIGFKEIINLPGNYHAVLFFFLGKAKHLEVKGGDDLSEARFFSCEEIKKLKVAESVEWVLREISVWN
ncbi:MAG: NUDIX domain-containing protein [Candidatus Woesearchaeota archaeon]